MKPREPLNTNVPFTNTDLSTSVNRSCQASVIDYSNSKA